MSAAAELVQTAGSDIAGRERATPRLRRRQAGALLFLVLAGMLNYVDRATLAVANPLIRGDLGLSVGEMGLLLSAFLWSYAFCQLPAGALVDRFGPRLSLTFGLTFWSLGQMLGGFVSSFSEFFAARLVLGVGEAPHFPTCARVTRDWFNVRGRGTATGIWNCAASLGSFLAVPLLTLIMLWVGWRHMFVIMGATGLVLALAFFLAFRDPPDVDLSAAERAHLVDGDAVRTASRRVTWADWRRLFAFRTTWGMIAGFFGCIYLTWIYGAWLPGYLEIERHFTVGKTGWVAAIPFAFGAVGGLAGGAIVDILARRGLSPFRACKLPMIAALVLAAAFTIVAAETSSDALAIGCISLAYCLLYIASSCAWTMPSVAAPPGATASVGSLQNFGGYLGGALAPAVTGFIVQGTGSFTAALLTGAAVALVGASLYAVLVRDPIPSAAPA